MFRAPRRFVYAWCTDFSPEDPNLEHEHYERRIVERNPRRVIYEDLESSVGGWWWARNTVRLRPPARWHLESVGNRRRISADYSLSELPGGRTRLDIRLRREPSLLKFQILPKRRWEREISVMWRRFAHALERDYRRTTKPRQSRGG